MCSARASEQVTPLVVRLDSDAALDVTLVGGKAAALAQLRRLVATGHLDGRLGAGRLGARPIVPDGFVITTAAHRVLLHDELPDALTGPVVAALADLAADGSGDGGGSSGEDDEGPAFAVRSSAVAEDAAGTSYAGLHDSVLGVRGPDAVLDAYRSVLASLHSERATSYRQALGQDPAGSLMAVLVQRLVRADLGGLAGVVFSRDPDGPTATTWQPDGVVIEAVAGLGDVVVGGAADHHAGAALLTPELRSRLVEVVGRLDAWSSGPVDLEWAVDGRTGELALLQLRPLAAGPHGRDEPPNTAEPRGAADRETGPAPRCTGLGIGHGRAVGRVRRLDDPFADISFDEGDILVTAHTDPAWLPLMQRAGAIVTDLGGRTSHAAIVSRELGLLAVVGCGDATTQLADGTIVRVECDGKGRGVVYGVDPVAEVRRPEA